MTQAKQKVIENYSDKYDRHFELIEVEKAAYKKGTESGDYSEVKFLCSHDFALAPFVKEFCMATQPDKDLPRYPAFELLAKIYEKEKNYEESCWVLQRALTLGFTKDGTDGGIRARLERMLKLGKINMTVEEYINKINEPKK